MDDEAKVWVCKICGAHLGRVRRNGSGARELLLYRRAVDMGAEDPAGVDVMARVGGGLQVADVTCSVCGAVRTWVPGKEALEKILGRKL